MHFCFEVEVLLTYCDPETDLVKYTTVVDIVVVDPKKQQLLSIPPMTSFHTRVKHNMKIMEDC